MQNLRWRNLETLRLSGFVLLERPDESTDASATYRRVSMKFPTYCVRYRSKSSHWSLACGFRERRKPTT